MTYSYVLTAVAIQDVGTSDRIELQLRTQDVGTSDRVELQLRTQDVGTSDRVELQLQTPKFDKSAKLIDVRVNGHPITFNEDSMRWQDFKGIFFFS